MTRYLQELRLHDNTTADMLQMLEVLSGHQSVDISLTAELQAQVKKCLMSLGLDPTDTNAEELYKVLESKVAADGLVFVKNIAPAAKTENDFTAKLAEHLNKTFATKTVLVPKKSVLKQIIKKNPPKAALKMLHYRSVDSMLRRCPMPILLAACEATEPKRWRKIFLQKIDKLQSNDFELAQVEFCSGDAAHWRDVHKALLARSGHSIYRVNVAGGIVIVPSDEKVDGASAALLLMAALSALAKLRAHASFTPRVLLDSSVPTKLSEHVYDLDSGAVIVRQVQFGWRELHHHLTEDKDLRQLFAPHLSKKTVESDDSCSLLLAAGQGLEWWADYLNIALSDGTLLVSANLYDVARNLAYRRPFGSGTTMAFDRELDLTIRLRYLQAEQLRQTIYEQLNAATDFEPDPLMLELEEDL